MPSSGGIAMTKSLIERVEAGHVLERAEAEATMEELLSGRVKTPKIVRLLEALNRRRFYGKQIPSGLGTRWRV